MYLGLVHLFLKYKCNVRLLLLGNTGQGHFLGVVHILRNQLRGGGGGFRMITLV